MNLIQQLIDIPAQQLNMLIFTLDPPKGIISPMPAPQGDRVFQFLQWAESNEGCGLESLLVQLGSLLVDSELIQELLEEIERNQSQSIELPTSIPLPDPKTITTGLLLEISKNNDGFKVFHVWDHRWYKLQSTFPRIGRHVTKKVRTNIEYAQAWKEIHTLTEELYPKYMKLYLLMYLSQKIPEESEMLKYQAEDYFKHEVENKCQSFKNSLNRLPIGVQLVKQLHNIPFCSPAILQGLTFQSDSTAFSQVVDLVKNITDLLLYSLHVADRLLEEFFIVNV
jgi:hypothetical protein